jgi:hypothetical protein
MLAAGTGRLDEEGATMSDQPPAYPPFPPPQQPSAAYPAAPGNQAPAMAPGEATTAYQLAYPQPGYSQPAYPQQVSAAPMSAYPVSGYPAPPTPAARRTSVWTWVFASLSVLLLLGAAGLGYVFVQAAGTISDQKSQIANLENTVDGHARTISDKDGIIRQRELGIDDLRGDLEAAEACPDAVRKTLRAADDAAFNVAYDEMVAECV